MRSLKWHDHDGIKHLHVVRSDDLDEVLREIGMVKAFIKAARARDEKLVATTPSPEPEAEPEQAESAYDEPTERTRMWCERHQTWLNRREKNGSVWYSHQTAEGWCRRGAK